MELLGFEKKSKTAAVALGLIGFLGGSSLAAAARCSEAAQRFKRLFIPAAIIL